MASFSAIGRIYYSSFHWTLNSLFSSDLEAHSKIILTAQELQFVQITVAPLNLLKDQQQDPAEHLSWLLQVLHLVEY